MSLLQHKMIEQVKENAQSDDAIEAVLMYGSFIKGEGDTYSDIEFYLFYKTFFDPETCVSRIAPVELFFTNEFGTQVAIFDTMIRGEFHFLPTDEMEIITSWEGHTSFEHADKMILVDKKNTLQKILTSISTKRPLHHTPDQVEWIASCLLNTLLHIKNLLFRGEWAHAHHFSHYAQKYLLWLLRLVNETDQHWESPTKNLENELSEVWYEMYSQCVPTLTQESLTTAYEKMLYVTQRVFDLLSVSRSKSNLLEKIKQL